MNGAELPGGVEAGGGPRKSLASGGLRVLPRVCVPCTVEAFVWSLVCATRAMAMD